MKLWYKNNPGMNALIGLLALMWVTYTLMYLLTPYFGDDWGYMGIFRSSTGLDGPYPLWQFWLADMRHWLHSNGRMANFLASFCLGAFPKWIIDVILGLGAAAGAALIVKTGGLWRKTGYYSMAILMVAVYMMVFPWWDMMFTIDFAFNYPFTLAVVLGAVYMLCRVKTVESGRWMTLLAVTVGFAAGCMHESASLPLLCGLVVWIWRGRRWKLFTAMQRRLLIAFAVGTILATVSPGIIFRLAGEESWRVPDDSALMLVVKSAPLTLLIFTAYVLLLLFSRHSRSSFGKLMDSRACIWAVAALLALAPVAAGGIVGRSGWFSQAYAMIFLCYWVRIHDIRVRPGIAVGVATVAWAAAAVQSIATVVVAVDFNRRMTDIDRAYIESADGVVFADDIDYLTEPWWTLQRIDHRTQDLYYERKAFADFHHKERLPVILPREAETLDFTLPLDVTFPSGVAIKSGRPTVKDCETAVILPFRRDGHDFYLMLPPRPLAWGERGYQKAPDEVE